MSGQAKIYRFGDFRLDTRARELHRNDEPVALAVVAFDCLAYLIEHRDRPVGRDELIAAVWGRADISESTLSHTIVRLRQALGDSGNDQHSIRTVPRLGYRWVAGVVSERAQEPTTDAAQPQAEVQDGASVPEAVPPAAGDSAPASAAPDGARRGRRWLPGVAGLLLAGAVAVLAAFHWWPREGGVEGALPVSAPEDGMPATLVMPAEVEASKDWAWLRLGLMDLVVNRLQAGTLATVPSETGLMLLEKAQRQRGGEQPDTGPRIQPRATQIDGAWRVALEARLDGGQVVHVEAQGESVMVAGRRAADELLLALGLAPPLDDGHPLPADPEELLQQLAAARLAGRIDRALELLQHAPEQWREQPEVALTAARIDCDRGEREACQRRLSGLLERLPPSEYPVLRGKVLTSVGWLHGNRAEYAQAEAALDAAVGLLHGRSDPRALGNALWLRGWTKLTASRLDEAMADLGLARTAFGRSGDLRGVARTDMLLGAASGRQGQPGAARMLLERAAERFEAIGDDANRLIALMTLTEVQEQLLEFDEALATSERFWSANAMDDLARASVRAWVLTRNGRLKEAAGLVEHVLAAADPKEDSALVVEMSALMARIAWLEGRPGDAVRFAGQAASPVLEETDRREYLGNWMVLIRSLRDDGRLDAAGREVARLRAWVEAAPDDWLGVGALLMEAEQALAEGRRQASLALYAEANALAERLNAPEWLVAVGYSYVPALIDAGDIEQAATLGGRLGAWADQDMRAAWVQARVLQGLGDADAAQGALRQAQRIAGERRLPRLDGDALGR